jgi:hypothetical protein
MSAAPLASELSPAILKLQHLRLVAAEALGASLGISRYVQDLQAGRAAIVREKRELEEHRTGNVEVREHTRRRIDGLVLRLAYVETEIAAAARLHEQLNANAGAARTGADNLAEHLRRELAAIGLRA